MIEIIAAIVGAVAGGLITWILAKKKPSYVICEEEFSEDLVLNLPETRFLFRDEPMESLHITRLGFRNMGTKVLEKPVFTVNVEKDSRIIGALHTFKPERGKSENLLCQIETEGDTLKITPSTLYPYELNQEILVIDIFTEEKTSIIAALGNGINSDGTGWSVRFIKRWVELSLLNVYAPADPLARFLGLGLYTALITSIFVLIGYFAWHTSKGLIIVNKQYLESMQNSIAFWIIIVISTLVILISLGFGFFREAPFPIPLPFKRILWIEFRRRKK
jgi:hypothetical protein